MWFPLLSVAFTVKLEVAAAVGVPDSIPAELSVRPAGKLPVVIVNEYEPLPPVAVIVWLYEMPTVPLASEGGLSARSFAGLTVSVYDWLPMWLPALSVALTVKL